MINVETKQSIKRLIGRTTNPFSKNKDKKLSAILNYHSVNPEHESSTRPVAFQRQMEYLISNFKVISLLDFYNMRSAGKEFSDKLAMVTFDDGFEDNYQHAFPVLKKLKIPATIFLTTGFITYDIDIAQRDKTYKGLKPLTWEQITEMHEAGMYFGVHTHTHPILTQIPLSESEKEIRVSKEILSDKLKEQVIFFAYPLGQPGTFNDNIKQQLKKHNLLLACSAIWCSNNSDVDILELRRVRIDPWDTFNDFKAKVSGQWDFIGWFQNAFRKR
jgi:peptidoglycan/xylan/chitin deacetylase (PgdA/CDA1 family)